MQASPSVTSLEHPETFPPVTPYGWSDSDLQIGKASIFRHTGWANHRNKVYQAFKRTDQSIDRVWSFCECGKHSYVVRSLDDPNKYRITGSTCHDRFCLPCANSRSHTIALNVLDRLAGKPARFITLTLHSTTESLDLLLRKLSAAFSALRRRADWRESQFGGAAFIEVKWVSGLERWNVHLHCLAHGRYLKQAKLSRLWKHVTGTSCIVDIRFVENQKRISSYVTKYASKPLHPSVVADPKRLDEAIVAMKGRRLVLTFGSWRGVCLTASPDEEAWQYVGSLEDIIERAIEGDGSSIDICNKLGVPDVIVIPEPRPPPVPKPSIFPPHTGMQPGLYDCDHYRYGLQWQ